VHYLTIYGSGGSTPAGTPINTFLVNNTPDNITTTINAGLGNALYSVSVLATGNSSTFDLNFLGEGRSPADLVDSVVFGDSTHGVQQILGPVNVTNSVSGTNGVVDITVDDSSDTTAQPAIFLNDSEVSGLAPAPISYLNQSSSTAPSSFVIKGGSGGNTFTVTNDGTNTLTPETIYTGTGQNIVNVFATNSAGLGIEGQGQNVVTVGDPSVGATGVKGPVAINDASSFSAGVTQLIVDDSGNAGPLGNIFLIAAAGGVGAPAIGRLSGVAPGLITYPIDQTVTQVTVKAPPGANTATVVFSGTGGNPLPPSPTGGFEFQGGNGTNTLNLRGTPPAGAFHNETYVPTNSNSGIVTFDGTRVVFSNLATFNDTVGASSDEIFASPIAKIINGPTVLGSATMTVADASGHSQPDLCPLTSP